MALPRRIPRKHAGSAAPKPVPVQVKLQQVSEEPVDELVERLPMLTKPGDIGPEHANRTSRNGLLRIWKVLDWLGNNRISVLDEATAALGIKPDDLRKGVVELGTEMECWMP